MELVSRKRLMLFSGSANPELAGEVAEILGVELGECELGTFANGEIYVRYTESVRGADCFVIQSHSHPVNYHIMEQFIMVDALNRASARRITAVMPFYGYARQDKKVMPREPITARLMGDFFMAAGADRLVSVDLHQGQIQGFIPRPFDHLTALPLFLEYLGKRLDGEIVVVSPDPGGVKLAEKYGRHLDAPLAFVHKRRSRELHNVSAALEVVGDLEGRHAVMVDDMIDTAGTVCNAATLLRERGAESVVVLATHGVLSPPAVDRLKNAPIEEVVITNTLPVPEEARELDKLTVLSVGPIVAEALQAIFTESSVSEIFLGENF